jgi:hypothetical protein
MTALVKEKIAVVAPIPNASEVTATAARPEERRKVRNAYRKSFMFPLQSLRKQTHKPGIGKQVQCAQAQTARVTEPRP